MMMDRKLRATLVAELKEWLRAERYGEDQYDVYRTRGEFRIRRSAYK